MFGFYVSAVFIFVHTRKKIGGAEKGEHNHCHRDQCRGHHQSFNFYCSNALKIGINIKNND
jgi:hypothetical protein